jgi:hypothetical protein
MRDLESQARTQLAEPVREGDILFDDTVEVAQILSETYDPPAGAAGTKLTLTMQVEFSALYASASDLTQLASLALNASLPRGFAAASEGLSLEPVTEPVRNDDGNTRWTVRAERTIVRQIDQAQVAQMIQGVGADRARRLLETSLPLDAPPLLSLSPSWWPWVPIVPFRLSVVTE